MKRAIVLLSVVTLVAACGGGGSSRANLGINETPGPLQNTPPPPAITGVQIDRMGRAAITSALVSPLADSATRGAQRDAYNASPQSDWSNFTADITASLGVYDALDANCGNQFLAGADDATRYDTFAGALIDDRLYVNSAVGMCTQYFGVELNATGVVPNSDCGGRTPLYDVIDVSYTALSNDLSIPVGDGVPSDNVMQGDSNFPFLAEFVPTPAVPAISGTQIDRMGRAAITSALISPIADDTTRGADRDAYNAAAQADWGNFSANLTTHLAVYDSLDASCGNQFLADPGATDSSRYAALTGALTDDRLYVNASSGTCTQYFGVELDATGVVPNGDCGGRTPLYDVIDVSYTALSNDLSVAVGDGVPSDNVVHSQADFPFLAAP